MSKDKKIVDMNPYLAFLLLVPLILLFYAWMGKVTTLIFAWYLVPLFGVPMISVVQGMGLVLIGSWFSGHAFGIGQDEEHTIKQITVMTVRWVLWYPLLLWLFHVWAPIG